MSRTPARVTQADVARCIADGKQFIYFIRAGEFIKIGRSRNWKARVASMQTGSPYTIIVLLVLVDIPRLERVLHSRFKNDHFRGEWFHSGPALLNYIKTCLPDCVSKFDVVEPPKVEPVEIVL